VSQTSLGLAIHKRREPTTNHEAAAWLHHDASRVLWVACMQHYAFFMSVKSRSSEFQNVSNMFFPTKNPN